MSNKQFGDENVLCSSLTERNWDIFLVDRDSIYI